MTDVETIKQPMNKDLPKECTLDLSNTSIYNQGNLQSSSACVVATLYNFEQSKQENAVCVPSKLEAYTKRNN